jgi:hypothetical protein
VSAARDVIASTLDESAGAPADSADLIDRRDDAVATVERNVARRFKRVLDDEQNEVLDRIRRAKHLDAKAVLPQPDALAEAYLRACEEELEHAVALGATFLADCGLRPVPIDSANIASQLAPMIAAELTEPWVADLVDLIGEHGEDAPRSDVVSSVRTAYRYRKVDRLAELSGVVVVDAFNLGIVAAARPSDTLEWIEGDNHSGADIEGDDGVSRHYAPVRGGDLERAIAVLVEGAMGPECRCVLAPVDRA